MTVHINRSLQLPETEIGHRPLGWAPARVGLIGGVGVVIGSQIPRKRPIYNGCLQAHVDGSLGYARCQHPYVWRSQLCVDRGRLCGHHVQGSRRCQHPSPRRPQGSIRRSSQLHTPIVGLQTSMGGLFLFVAPRISCLIARISSCCSRSDRVGCLPPVRYGGQTVLAHTLSQECRMMSIDGSHNHRHPPRVSRITEPPAISP